MPNGAGGRAAGRRARIAGDGDSALPAARPLPDVEAAGRLADLATQDPRGKSGHGRPDDAAKRRQDSRLRAGRKGPRWRRSFEQAAQARTHPGEDGEELAAPAEHRAVHQGDSAVAAGVVGGEARLEGIGSVQDDVRSTEKLRGSRCPESHGPGYDLDPWSTLREAPPGRLHLQAADVVFAVEDLARQVGALDAIVVDEQEPQGKAGHPGLFTKEKRGGAAKPSHSEDDGSLRHARASRLNSRSPLEMRARPPSAAARNAAAAEACEASTPVSRASPVRARAQRARGTGLRSTEPGKSTSRGSPGSSSSAATSAMPRAPGSAPGATSARPRDPGSARRAATRAARAPAGAITARTFPASRTSSGPSVRSMALAAASPSSAGSTVSRRDAARAKASAADAQSSTSAPKSRSVSRVS